MPNPPKPPFEMPPPPDGAVADPLTREGMAWLLHLNSGNETPGDWTAFEVWQNWSEAHKQAAARAMRMWEQLGPTLTASKKRAPRLPVVLAASVGIAALAFWSGAFGPPASYFADYKSSTGEVRSVVIRDGSEVDLDTGTSFDVSDGDRTITLYTGQIFVNVKLDGRPFTVIAGPMRATALGTAFAVRRDGDGGTVLVSQSAVRVTSTDAQTPQSVDISAGQVVTLTGRAGLGTPRQADVASLTSWRGGELRFAQRPLGEVVGELDRYRRGKILIVGGELRTLPVTGNVAIGDADGFLSSLQIALPVRVFRLPGLTTIIRDPIRR
jgi:transmembrane sensor